MDGRTRLDCGPVEAGQPITNFLTRPLQVGTKLYAEKGMTSSNAWARLTKFLKELRQFCTPAGACQHALGYHQDAVHDYEKAFSIDSGNKDKVSDETRSLQFLAFYQKELALYIRKHLDDPVAAFCLDKDLHPIFKVCVCPSRTCE